MRRPRAMQILSGMAALTLAVTIGVSAQPAPQAVAATGPATGFATQNGGTTGGASGRTVQASSGTAIHTALCTCASSSTPIIIEVTGTINHGNTQHRFDNGKHGFTYNRNLGSMAINSNLSIGNEERNDNFDGGSSTFRDSTSCESGSNDRIIGDDAGGNQWDSGSNGSRCGQYSGSLDWSFASDGRLVVTIGGNTVNL